MKAKFIYYLPYRVITALFIIICLHSPSFSQTGKMGSLAYLKSRNGIGEFNLGAPLSSGLWGSLSYLDGEGSKLDADSCITYEYRPDKPLELDGGLTASHICIRTYEDKVINIYVFFDRNEGYKMLSKFLHWYGTFTAKPNDYQDIYMWESRTVKLTLSYHPDNEDGIAVYTSVPLINAINAKNARRLTQLLTANDK